MRPRSAQRGSTSTVGTGICCRFRQTIQFVCCVSVAVITFAFHPYDEREVPESTRNRLATSEPGTRTGGKRQERCMEARLLLAARCSPGGDVVRCHAMRRAILLLL